ncbi:AraC family transcriptional regulator [Nostoc sp. UHCC 0926]|uniref:AraC family transcriptional regulator n=1 Tax=unclassified Nostoc TaxID=2593658 RepID=UPI00235FA68A|nr:AraC family transcriptional regulator [Nostoc sp. UHCC 0926]WDD30557.1 AraC family transcriptional regulator [Nostoc sp. UHCC 0926]
MTITLTLKEQDQLWAEARQNSLQNPEPDEFICQMPRLLGKGYERNIQVYPNILLTVHDLEYHDDVLVKFPESDHPLQFSVDILGVNTDNTLISGAGIQRSWTEENPKFQRSVFVNIHMPPELLGTFFPTVDGEISSQFSFLVKGNDWQTMLQPKKTAAINSAVQQIINCPYQGITKRVFLQARVPELIGLHLTSILVDQGGVQRSPRLKPETITRIYHARDILHSRLENPPSLLELAQLVGVSDRTLKPTFRTSNSSINKLHLEKI